MAYFGDVIADICKEYMEMPGNDADLCTKIQTLACCTNEISETRRFLAILKELLKTKPVPDVDLLKFLVPLYLSISNKNAAKKILSSYFSGLAPVQKETVHQLLCQRVQELCASVTFEDNSSCQTLTRHRVDMLTALMDNFTVGERCVTTISTSVLLFMAKCQDYFFYLFRQGGQSPVHINSLMHDCHVTMQALNRFTQRHLGKEPESLNQLTQSTITSILQKDIEIMMEEQMMMDCRCCCAISLILLLQITVSDIISEIVLDLLELGTPVRTFALWLQPVTLPLNHLRLSRISPLTSLALFWGLLSMLDADTLFMAASTKEAELTPVESETATFLPESHLCSDKISEAAGERCGLVCEFLLKKLLTLDEQCITTASRVQCMKTVTLWTTRIMSCLREAAATAAVRQRLRGESDCIKQVLNFVWTHWQDQLDAVRQNCRIIFDSCMRLHVSASQCKDAASDKFLLSLLHLVLEMDWSNHAKFSALACIVSHVGSQPVLRQCSNFPSTLLAQMRDHSLSCHASELYHILMSWDRIQGTSTEQVLNGREQSWLAVWVDPIIVHLCSSNTKVKQHIVEYILPKVMKQNKAVLEYMLSCLSLSKGNGSEHLGALIVCLRRARAWGLMSETLQLRDSASSVWTQIYSALSSAEEQVRLDAFALLCENKRTSEAVSTVEFQHLQHFITYNLNNQSPAFRQTMLSFIKKLFFRINESHQALQRQKKKGQMQAETERGLLNYSSFLCWLQDFLFAQLYPSAAFARRTTSLAILTLLVQDIKSDGESYKPLRNITTNYMHTLLECLTDTFDANKQEAFKLLLACTSQHPDIVTAEKWSRLYSVALQLAVSTRPQDCSTAAYIFRLLLAQPLAVSVIQSLTHCSQSIACHAEHRLASKRADDDTGYAVGKAAQWPDIEKLIRELGTEVTSASSTLQLLQVLLLLLLDQMSVARTSLILAAANRPIYPTLHCIRCILDDFDFRSLADSQKPVWRKWLSCLLQACLQVATIVSPVVQNSSPEGNIPEEAILGPGLKFDLDLMAEVEDSRQTVWRMPEYLVVCCWRSIKEVSLLLGQVSACVPVTQPAVSQGLLSVEQIKEIGCYFKHQLMESLHRGAFELAYAGFLMLCQMLWKSSWEELQTLPRHWLEEVLSAVIGSKGSSNLCATRRSAGVPFFIQAIVATETAASGRPSFDLVMNQLLHLASSTPSLSAAVSMLTQTTNCDLLPAHSVRDLSLSTKHTEKSAKTSQSARMPTQSISASSWHASTSQCADLPTQSISASSWHASTSQFADVPTQSISASSWHASTSQFADVPKQPAVASSQTASTDNQVHALNILRTLFRDTRLAEDVAPHICEGLKVAILGFKSQFWEIRNSSTLLLSALMTRIFGVKRSKDDFVPSKENSQTGRAFFHKFPALYQFLLTELQVATQNFGSSLHLHQHLSLYPVLMVLGRLFPSTMENTTTRLNLSAFVPFVIKCSSSSVYKTRVMAARALQPLTGRNQVSSVLSTLLALLPTRPLPGSLAQRISQSHIHGLLLQVYHLLLLTADMSKPVLQTVASLCASTWLSLTWLITRQNSCLCTRKVALDVTDLILCSAAPVKTCLPASDQRSLCSIRSHLLDTLHTELWPSTPCYNPHTPFLSQFLDCVATLVLKNLPFSLKEEDVVEKTLLRLLNFQSYEVHLAVLEFLTGTLQGTVEGKDGVLSQTTEDEQSLLGASVAGDGVIGGCSTKVWTGVDLPILVIERLLLMGLQDAAHTETATKIFRLLALPPVAVIFNQRDIIHVFEQVVSKLKTAKSVDLKAALIQFSSSLFPGLYTSLQQKTDDLESKQLKLLQEWCVVLMASCDREQQPVDLHLSCTHLLKDNAVQILADKDRCLGMLVFEFWHLLMTLLQTDDLEVREVAASAAADLGLSGFGGSHPEQILGDVIRDMFLLHFDTSADHCLATAFSWVMHNGSVPEAQEGEERLFDKGELNTFQDCVALARVVSGVLEQIFNSHRESRPSDTFIQSVIHASHREFTTLSHSFADADNEASELLQSVQKVINLTEAVSIYPQTGKNLTDSLEAIFLMSSHYSNHTVLLIKCVLFARNLKNLQKVLPLAGAGLGVACEHITNFVKVQLNRHSSCNYLLGVLAKNLESLCD